MGPAHGLALCMSSFDPSAAEQFLVAVRAGADNVLACEHAGIDEDDLEEWLDDDPEFEDTVAKARADLQLFAIGVIRRNISEDANQALWIALKLDADRELDRLRRLTT